ncbi:DNA-binding protein [Kitasatospora sp. NPDC058218]|uniref:DNA-binding protein n=1 Tax=Kitasatospora sp. NPDC058218 TaxID=3346385 RepID=UPI0036DE762E
MSSGIFCVAPLAGETVWSLMGRVAERYGVPVAELRALWEWKNQPPRAPGVGGVRPDAEILLDPAGQDLMVAVCRADRRSLERALPAWSAGPGAFAGVSPGGRPQARWQLGGVVHGPVAYACRLCTAGRAGQDVVAAWYRERWQRVCPRHGRWLLGAGDGHGLEHLSLADCPEIAAAQRRWPVVAARAVAAGVEPSAVFSVAWAVVCQWWELALGWERERWWPARLHALAGGDAGSGEGFWWWRVVAREAVLFPEVVAVAEALLDPAVAEAVWRDSGGERVRPFPGDGEFVQELGRRLGRPWLGEVDAVAGNGALVRWRGAVVRRRRDVGQVGERDVDPWWLPREEQPVSVAAQLRTLAQRADGSISWRASVPREERAWIGEKVREAADLVGRLDVHDTAALAVAARELIGGLRQSVAALDEAVVAVATAAHHAGVPLDSLSVWSDMSVEELSQDVVRHRAALEERYG